MIKIDIKNDKAKLLLREIAYFTTKCCNIESMYMVLYDYSGIRNICEVTNRGLSFIETFTEDETLEHFNQDVLLEEITNVITDDEAKNIDIIFSNERAINKSISENELNIGAAAQR